MDGWMGRARAASTGWIAHSVRGPGCDQHLRGQMAARGGRWRGRRLGCGGGQHPRGRDHDRRPLRQRRSAARRVPCAVCRVPVPARAAPIPYAVQRSAEVINHPRSDRAFSEVGVFVPVHPPHGRAVPPAALSSLSFEMNHRCVRVRACVGWLFVSALPPSLQCRAPPSWPPPSGWLFFPGRTPGPTHPLSVTRRVRPPPVPAPPTHPPTHGSTHTRTYALDGEGDVSGRALLC